MAARVAKLLAISRVCPESRRLAIHIDRFLSFQPVSVNFNQLQSTLISFSQL